MTGETMTLAFELAALRQTREPQAVVVDARRWAQNVGLISTDFGAAHAFSAKYLVRRDFQVMPTASDLRHLGSQYDTERHVLIGTTSNRPEYLPPQHWEYLSLADAATAAGWSLENPETTLREQWTARLYRVLRRRE
ncbi:hypothetical protein AUR65_016280 [Haloferax marisrubri]|uniref:DUF7124 domain-containing protein n=1 Tax=Haloferax marisrubri TaxID=1544719 RepID=A0A2P4NM56_9EURY|nr:hypothetical protein AUR65_016280 [Haloferax marisrubri]RDZ30405.1 hypothetical protein DEQ67_15300 [Haloferax sp. Atlit-48N]